MAYTDSSAYYNVLLVRGEGSASCTSKVDDRGVWRSCLHSAVLRSMDVQQPRAAGSPLRCPCAWRVLARVADVYFARGSV